jgi:hypothetical protein
MKNVIHSTESAVPKTYALLAGRSFASFFSPVFRPLWQASRRGFSFFAQVVGRDDVASDAPSGCENTAQTKGDNTKEFDGGKP